MIKKIISKLNSFKKMFTQKNISFNRTHSASELKKLVEDKNFYELRNYLPSIISGSKRFNKGKSVAFILSILAIGITTQHHILPFVVLAITFGSAVTYDTAAPQGGDLCMIDSTNFFLVYRGTSALGYGQIGTISGSTITYGSASVFYGAAAGADNKSPRVALLDSTHVVVTYERNDSSNQGNCIVGVFSGNTISSWGSPVQYVGVASHMSICALDSTHFVTSYQDGSNGGGSSICGSVSGTTVTFGSRVAFNSGTPVNTATTMLDSTHFIVSYGDSTNGNSRVGSISGTAITFGTETSFATGATVSKVDSAMVDSTHAIITYNQSSNGWAVVATTSGTSVSFGTRVSFDAQTQSYTTVSVLSSTSFVVSFDGEGDGETILGTLSGTTITFPVAAVQFATNAMYIRSTALSSTAFIVAYRPTGNNNGNAIAGNSPPATNIKTIDGLAKASIKTVNGLAIASVKTVDGLS